MTFEDNTTHVRSGSVRPIQLETPRTAGGPASALASYSSVLEAQRLSYDSSQAPDARNYRGLSPDSVFPPDEARAGPLQNPLYDASSPVFEPPVRQHQHVEEEVPEGTGLGVTPEETRIDPPRVKHTDCNERAIKAQESHIQSMIRHYCGDSEETQVRALELILKYHGKICRIERRKRAGAPSGGVQLLACLLCPSTSDDQTVHFQKTNAVRTFAEHLTHKHLHIPNPFVCLAGACGKVFPYSQDRDRHEKQIHKMYRPKAYEALLKTRAHKQRGMPPVHMDNPQSPTEFIEYVGPAQVNPHQPAALGAHRSILPSYKPRTVRRPSPEIDSGVMFRSDLTMSMSNHRVAPYKQLRKGSSTPRSSRRASRSVSHSIPSNNGTHCETYIRGQPIMMGPKSRIFPTSSQSCAPFDGMQGSVDVPPESCHAPGGAHTQTQASPGHYSAPTTMSQHGSNMVSNPPMIGLTMPSSISYQDPSTSVYAYTPSLPLGNQTPMELAYGRSKEGLTYPGSMYSSMQNRVTPFSAHTQYQHDNHGISRSTQPFHHGYVGPAMYQGQPQQAHQDGSRLYGNFYQNTPDSTTAMSYTTPHPTQMPGYGASSYTTCPPSGGSHVINPDELNNQFHYDTLRPFTPNSSSDYTTHGGAGTSRYNQPYNNNNNTSRQW